MRLLKGNYPVPERGSRFVLAEDLDFLTKPSFLVLVGENGIGKTTFIEKVLIPSLKGHPLPFLYLGQDLITQLYTLKSMLAVTGHLVKGLDLMEIVTLWAAQSTEARVFILDEFDRHINIGELLAISRNFIRTYVLVSHAGPGNRPDPGEGMLRRILRFEQIKQAASVPDGFMNIHIREVPSW